MNLLTDSFLPVIDRSGAPRRLSLNAALSDAKTLRAIHHASPLVTVACYRLMLAVLQRAVGDRPAAERREWWIAQRFPQSALDAYWSRWADRFDLFDATRPFLQVVDLAPEQSRRPWTALAAERSSGNNKLLFDHASDGEPSPLAAADAALYLLAAQGMALGGGRSAFQYTAHAPAASAALALMQGDNLFQTLALNMIPQDARRHAEDEATWERDQPLTSGWMQDGPMQPLRGIAQLYTLPSRSIRLFPDEGGGTVTWVGLASGERLDLSAVDSPDPMVTYRIDPERGWLPMQLRYERAFWRDFHALRPRALARSTADTVRAPLVVENAARVLADLRSGVRPTLRVFGQCTDKAKIELWRAEQLPVPQNLLRDGDAWDVICEAIELAEKHGEVLLRSANALARHLRDGGAPPDPKAVRAQADSFLILPGYWTQLGAAFSGWIETLGQVDPDQARANWRSHVASAFDAAWALADRVVSRNYRGDRALMLASHPVHLALRALTRSEPAPKEDRA